MLEGVVLEGTGQVGWWVFWMCEQRSETPPAGNTICESSLGDGQEIGSFLSFFFFWTMPSSLWDLSSPLGIETEPLAVKVQSPNHWTAREFPEVPFYYFLFFTSNLFIQHRLNK